MDIRLDKNNPIPVGVQVKEQIKMLVNSGIYNAGDKLPSINQLALSLGVNKNTIVTIFKELEHEGYIESHRGKGVFISNKSTANTIDTDFLKILDQLILEANSREMNASQLINLISARFSYSSAKKAIKGLFVIGISQKLADINVEKLRRRIPGIEFEGLFLGRDMTRDELVEAFNKTDFIIIPSIVYNAIKEYLPEGKTVIRTSGNLKPLSGLKKGMEKKSKIAVLAANQKWAFALEDMFISAMLFRPKLVIGLNNIEKYKKELKEIETIVACISTREFIENTRLKEKTIYYFSDYINEECMEEIKYFMAGRHS